jgi:hypothetical protein
MTINISNTQNPQGIISSVSIGSISPEDVLDLLGKGGIEYYITVEGDLMFKYWQIYENFVPKEQAAILRTGQPVPEQVDRLEWLSNNLDNIRRDHSGHWIAILNNEVVASAVTLPESVVWDFTFAYGIQKF